MVGAGYTATEHAKAFADIERVDLTAIHSRTSSRANEVARRFGFREVVGSVAELYERSRADLVVVAVPELAMNAVVSECLAFPWAVLMEKPPGFDLADAEDLAGKAASHQEPVLVGLNRRFISVTRQIREDLEVHAGKPRFIKVQDQQDQEAALRAGLPQSVVENLMYANSIHTVDYFFSLGEGEVKNVNVVDPWQPENPGVVIAELRYDNGDIGLYEGIWNAPGPWAVSVTVPGVRWEARPLERAFRQGRAEGRAEYEVDQWDVDFKPGFRAQAEAVVQTVEGEARAATVAEALETMRLISKIFAAGVSP